jgi:eukaryotic-like serine/threonine-protein kinase
VELTASLLDERFEIVAEDRGGILKGEHAPISGERMLLGRPSPCVGREGELARLASVYEECVAEGVARAVVVLAPAGVGKSRLAKELVRRLHGRGAPSAWIAQADRSRRGSPLALLADVVRTAVGVSDGEPLDAKQSKIRAHVTTTMSGPDVPQVAEFLCELVGAAVEGDPSPILRAARHDARVLSEQIHRAWRRFIAAECTARPVLIVLEDLQWADPTSVTFLEDALGENGERALMILALARPEVEERFPRLWAERATQWVTLPPLTRRAGEALVKSVLGDSIPPGNVGRLVERAGGNAFFLEELIRAVADGRGDHFPDTILATVQARLDAMEIEARRLLRAASLFGQIFWRGGVDALIADVHTACTTDAWWEALVERELILLRNESRFAGEREYAFRHAFVCDAAYAMLPPEERAFSHRCVGAWLERAGETDAYVLAEHAERGGELVRAVALYLRAAEQAFATDVGDALLRIERGIACGAEGELLGSLLASQARGYYFKSEAVAAEHAGLRALELLPRASPYWCMAASVVALVSGALGHGQNFLEIVTSLRDLDEKQWKDAIEPRQVMLVCVIEIALLMVGANDAAQLFASRLDQIAPRAEAESLVCAAWLRYVDAVRGMYVQRDPAAALTRLQASARLLEEIGDPNGTTARIMLANVWVNVGNIPAGEKVLEECMRPSAARGNPLAVNLARGHHAELLAHRGRHDEAVAQGTEVRDLWLRESDPFFAAVGRQFLTRVLAACGRLEAAEAEGRAAVEGLAAFAPHQVFALATLARVLVARGAAREALEIAERAVAMYASGIGPLDAAAPLDLAMAEALHASGEVGRARAWIEAARERLRGRAERLPEEMRRGYFNDVPDHARIEALAAEWSVSRQPV